MFQELLLPLATFLVGALFGWFGHKFTSTKQIENWERSMVTVVVTFAWVISVVLDVALDTYETPVALHGVMGMVVGYFFEGGVLNRNKK